MQHLPPPHFSSDDAAPDAAEDAANDAALLAWSCNPQPGGDFTPAQRLRSLLALVAPAERAAVLRALGERTR